MAYLRLSQGNTSLRIDLTDEPLVIGRKGECRIVLDNEGVSRHHAKITHRDGGYFIEDCNSRNHTYLNGVRITLSTRLVDSDSIRICHYLLTFHASPSTDDSKLIVTDDDSDSSRIHAIHDSTMPALTPTPSPAPTPDELTVIRPEDKLRAFDEIARSLVSELRVELLLPKVLDSLFTIFPQADRGYVLLGDSESGEPVVKAMLAREHGERLGMPVPRDGGLRISRAVLDKVWRESKAVLVHDAMTDAALGNRDSVSEFLLRSILCVPLLLEGGPPTGLLWIHTEDRHRHFTNEDLDLLVSVAGMLAIAVARAQTHETLVAQVQEKRDVEDARMIQQAFLPMDWPEVEGYEFFAFYEPAFAVGGDYYGFVERADERLVIALADVSGKGLPAALLTLSLSGEVRHAAAAIADPAAAVRTVNRSIMKVWPEDKFVTLLYIVLDWKRHTISVVNAGHMPPLVRMPSGAIEPIGGGELSGPPLNTVAEFPYQAVTHPIAADSVVLLYTDGIVDARNKTSELFGPARLGECLRSAQSTSASVGDTIVRALRRFAAGPHHADDITLVCFARSATAPDRPTGRSTDPPPPTGRGPAASGSRKMKMPK